MYPLYAFDGIKLAQRHRLGYDERTGKKAAMLTRPWLYVFGLSLLGNTLYMQVLKTLVAVLVCDYDTNTLARDPAMECWSWDHVGYIVAAAVAALCYYPVSTFLYPNFQFALDSSTETHAIARHGPLELRRIHGPLELRRISTALNCRVGT